MSRSRRSPRLSMWPISLTTNPGDSSVTETPSGASSPWMHWAKARKANLLDE